MGVDLVKQVAVRHGHLNGNAYKVLMYMALLALDEPNANGHPANLYYAGWEPLALALGYKLPIGGDDTSKQRRRKQYGLVKRALADLRRDGVVEALEDHPRTGLRQTYRLNLRGYKK